MKMNILNSNVAKRITAIIVSLLLLCSSFLVTNAAGSAQLNPTDNKFRLYSDWNSLYSAGLPRHQLVKVYMIKGEAAYFGSSMASSRIDVNGNVLDTVSGCDIVVTTPTGTVNSFDVNQSTGEGYVNTRKKELSGPKYYNSGDDYSVQTKLNTDGYIPLEYIAPETGLYTFKFYSESNEEGAVYTYARTLVSLPLKQGSGTVGMWDVTVVDKNNTANPVKTGRSYVDYLSLTTGGNSLKADMDIYVLTNDGFIYKVHMDDLDPWGFILFANNRGLTTTALDDESVYHSIGTTDNLLSALTTENGVKFHSPFTNDTDIDCSFKIFFEKPSEDLEGILYGEPEQPSIPTNIKFFGYKENASYYRHGGYINFDISNASSATVTIDFTSFLGNVSGYNGSGLVEISNAVTDGNNTFYWDGKDTVGQYIPIGLYEMDGAKISVQPKAGEIHFPLVDVEAMEGIEITRENSVYSSNGDVVEKDSSHSTDIYYNNNPLVSGTITGELPPVVTADNKYYDLLDSTYTPKHNYVGYDGKTLSSLVKDTLTGLYHHTPLDSSAGIYPSYDFIGGNVFTGGNQAIIDVWTYYSDPDIEAKVSLNQISIDPEPAGGVVNVNGRIFYDNDNDGMFSPSVESTDYVLPNIPVVLTNLETNESYDGITDSTGVYHFFNIPYGEYSIEAKFNDFQQNAFICTTNNAVQNVTISKEGVNDSSTYSADDVGLYTRSDIPFVNYVVRKRWDENTQKLGSIIVELWAEYEDAQGNPILMNTGGKRTVSAGSNWSCRFNNYPRTYITDEGTKIELKYFVKEYYLEDNEEILIGVSDYNAQYTEFQGRTISNESNQASQYTASFDYSTISENLKSIVITNTLKNDYAVTFFTNSSVNDKSVYRVYAPATSSEGAAHMLTADNQINSFYNIPTVAGKIFKGWYYDLDNENDSRPIKWDTDTYTETTNIYAHWIDIGSVPKDQADDKVTHSNIYRGFDLFGVQARNALDDPNYPDGNYPDIKTQTGLRFVTSLKESILTDLDELFTDGMQYNSYTTSDLEYGYVTAKKTTADKYANGTDYKLQYKDTNVNGVDTTTDYKYISNIECTSKVGGYTDNGTNIEDHRNFDAYRIYSMVITYDNPDEALSDAAKKVDIVARPYIRYTDSNGLYRTFYNDYIGTRVYGGCSTNYNSVITRFI